MATPIRYTRDQLQAAGACDFALFEASPDRKGDVVETTAERLAQRCPHALAWLAGKGILPLSVMEAARIVAELNPEGRRWAPLNERGEAERKQGAARNAAAARAARG